MRSFTQKIKRLFYTRIFVLFNLSAVAFTFQACYGVPQDDWMDVTITGYVADSETREPIPGIQVEVKKNGSHSYTDEEGFFVVRAENDTIYGMIFTDVDGDENGSYWEKATPLLDTIGSNELSMKVMMNRKIN